MGLFPILFFVPALVVKLVFNRTIAELIGPYLAYSIPGMIFLPCVTWLRENEGNVRPKTLALAWSFAMAMLFCSAIAATSYSAVTLRIVNLDRAIWTSAAAMVFGSALSGFRVYPHTLKIISERTAQKRA